MRYITCLSGLLLFIGLSFSAKAQDLLPLISGHLEKNAALYHITKNDIAGIEVISQASSLAENVKHVYIRQTRNGIPLINGLATVTIRNNEVIHVASRLKAISGSAVTSPAVSAENAIKSLASSKGLVSDKEVVRVNGNSLYRQPDLSRKDIPVKLCYYVAINGTPELSWDMSIETPDGKHWWSARVSAQSGAVIEANDWIHSCSFDMEGKCVAENHGSSPQSPLLPPPPPGTDQYLVYALPLESPAHGNRSLVINPSDPVASPYGWHDTNGFAGDEYTITRGNNVYASDDIDNDDEPGFSPGGGTGLNFSFPYDSLTGVEGNLSSVITNLFYMNNMMHDIWQHYGFDEESGNFQQLNYSGEGLDGDYVLADAQDGSGTNNANFGTPPDGDNPRMQMYLWTENNVSDLLTINAPGTIDGSYNCSTAGFGPPVPTIPITEDVILVNDGSGTTSDGCQTILNGAAMNGKIALVRRGDCTFAEKVEACEAEGAVAVIVMNNTGGAPISMGGGSGTNIPSIMVSQSDGNLLEQTIINGAVVNATIVNPGDLTATDSDFDNMIIAHEYGHGISTRLTGGAFNSECLYNAEQMGEGWSDWFGLMITMKETDVAAQSRGVGTYVTNQPNNGTGIRPAPYSTSFALNNFTYSATNNQSAISEPHGIGFVWASMLWDLNWALIDEYGFDADVKNGDGGNNKAMALVIEGLKLQPCGPGFVDGRDAILEADQILYEGVNQCLIWEVFARRGLGFGADQGSAQSRSDQTQAFDLPPACASAGIAEQGLEMVMIYPNPASDLLNIDMSSYSKVRSIRIVDLTGKVLYENNSVTAPVTTVDLSGWGSGIYLVQLTDVNGAKAFEVVKR